MDGCVMYPIVRTGLGRSMHRFVAENQSKPCILGGVLIKECQGFQADTDGDVVCEALCMAIASLASSPILHEMKQVQAKDGITDSRVFVQTAVKALGSQKITHVVINLECQFPQLSEEETCSIRTTIAELLQMPLAEVSLLSFSGDGLTDCSCGAGVQALVCITTQESQVNTLL